MARGIVASKPGGMGGSASGRLIVSQDAGAPAAGIPPMDAGTNVQFIEVIKANVGDIVDFNVGADGMASNITLIKTGTLISGSYQDNITVAAGESILIGSTANVEGTILLNGGLLTITDSSYVSGKIESSIDGSYMFVDNACTIEGKVEMTGASTMSIKNSTIEGKISSMNNTFAAVQGCTVNGKLEVLNAVTCKTFGNTVLGQVNTPGCPAK
jgi:hypothetical protein